MIFDTLLGTLALGSAAAATLTPGNSQQVLGRFEADAGWVQLFDGETTAGWRGIGKDAFPARGWDVVDGCLHHKAGGRQVNRVANRSLYLMFTIFLSHHRAAGSPDWQCSEGCKSRSIAPEFSIREEAGLERLSFE